MTIDEIIDKWAIKHRFHYDAYKEVIQDLKDMLKENVKAETKFNKFNHGTMPLKTEKFINIRRLEK